MAWSTLADICLRQADTPMSYLTPLTIAGYAKGAGFAGNDVAVAVAIAEAESGGNTQARGDHGTSVGLWQIHLPAHPEFNGQNLDDPATNARAAKSVKDKSGWSAWSTYGGVRYLALLPAAEAVALAASPLGGVVPSLANDAAQAGVDAGVATAGAAIRQAAAVSGFLADLQDPAIWLRILKVLVGAGMVLVAVDVLVSSAAKPLVAPAAKIAKLV
jgi:hypothetical protein